MKRRLLTLLATCLLAACHGPGTDSTAMQLKLYNVPAQRASAVADALGQVLAKQGRISTPGPGRLLVYAPQATQDSIGQAIAQLSRDPSMAPPAEGQVRLQFWLVDALPGAGTDSPALKPLAGALDSLRQAGGPLHFQLVQTAATVGQIDAPQHIETRDSYLRELGAHSAQAIETIQEYQRVLSFRIEQASGKNIQLSLTFEDGGRSGLGQLQTRVATADGDYLVLAQAPGVCPTEAPCQERPSMRLLVIRADRLKPTT